MSNRKKTVSSTNGVGKIRQPYAENETEPFPYTAHKNRLKMDERPESMKILENTGSNLFDLSCSNFLLETSPKAREARAKMNYWDFIQIKSFCTAKETVNRTKRQQTEREKIFPNDISDKGLVSKI